MMNKKLKKARKFSRVAGTVILLTLLILFLFIGVRNKNNNSLTSSAARGKDNTVSDYRLVIDKIDVSAPIVINVDGSNKDEYDKSLENGVAHLKGSALPGHYGNVFIFAHSSYYIGQLDNYKQIFSKLDDMTVGDTFEITNGQTNIIIR